MRGRASRPTSSLETPAIGMTNAAPTDFLAVLVARCVLWLLAITENGGYWPSTYSNNSLSSNQDPSDNNNDGNNDDDNNNNGGDG